MALNPKQARFVAEYLIDLNGTQAAIRAGYSAKTAQVQSSRLLSLAKVRQAVKAKTAKQLEKVDLTAERVKERIGVLAFQDVREFFDADGNLKPIKSFSDAAAAQVASFEIIKKNAAAGDGVIDTVHKVKTVDAVKSLEMLAKHFGLLTEQVEIKGGLVIKHELPE